LREEGNGISRLAEVSRRLASGEFDGSGRFFTDEELAAGAAAGQLKRRSKTESGPAA
jgi:hypothetical protein